MHGSLALVFEDLLIEVHADAPDDQEWLAEFLLPAFARGDATNAARMRRRVELVDDSAGLVALAARTEASGAEAVAFLLDSGPLGLPAAGTAAGLELLDRPLTVGYVRRPDGAVRIIEATGSKAGPRSARVALMRVVREWALDHLLRTGSLLLHAAAVEREGRAAIVCGPKGAGKTSLVAALLARTRGLRLLANDRVRVSGSPTGPRCSGLPSIVSVRPGTLDYLPELPPRLTDAAVGHTRRPGEPGTPGRLSGGRIGLSPRQWADVLGVELAAEADPAAILFVRAEAGRSRTVIRPLDPEECAGRADGAVFASRGAGQGSDLCALPEVGPLPDAAATRAKARDFLATVAGFEVLLGGDAYAGDRLAELLSVTLP